MTATGHVFILHGKIEHLVHDAAIIPVDRGLNLESHWHSLLHQPTAPTTWDKGWGRISGSPYWLVEVGDGDYGAVETRLRRALEDIQTHVANRSIEPSFGRPLPLIALPVLGIGAGGHAHERGRTIRTLATLLTESAPKLGFDIALVTPDSSVYAAAQFARRTLKSSVPQDVEDEAIRIASLARSGDLALFLGAGTSIPAGLKSWHELLAALLEQLEERRGQALVALPDLKNLAAVDQAELIERLDRKGFQCRVAELTNRAERPSLLHVLTVGLDVHEIVTTNYDLLYEQAARAAGHEVRAVLPWGSAGGASRWILKLHGDVKHRDKIVLTRRHMVRFDAANRPSGAMLQSLFLTRHMLFLGTSFTDDNLIRLAHEVQAYREDHAPGSLGSPPPDYVSEPFGTVLDVSGDSVRAKLWGDEFRWVHHDSDEVPSTRAVELLLDRVGMHASEDSSWLLDPRFAGLLSDGDQKIAELARNLFEALPASDHDAWGPLRSRLADFGARPSR